MPVYYRIFLLRVLLKNNLKKNFCNHLLSGTVSLDPLPEVCSSSALGADFA